MDNSLFKLRYTHEYIMGNVTGKTDKLECKPGYQGFGITIVQTVCANIQSLQTMLYGFELIS